MALLDGNAQLRRMLSDPAVDPGRRERLAADLFADRLSAPASGGRRRRSYGRPGASRRTWSTPRDELAAQALFAMAEQVDVLDEVEDELFRFGRILDREPALRRALTDPSLPADRKTELLAGAAGRQGPGRHPGPRPRGGPATARPHHRPRARGVRAAGCGPSRASRRPGPHRRTAVRASSTSASRASLESRLGHPVALNVELDPDLVGGLTVRVGDVLFDGSIAHRLALARRVMTG